MLRITGGTLRGRKVPLPAHELRPTSGKARQAFFNILSSRIEDASFLDLFSGSGIFSLEAVSRGARSVLAIDESRPAMNGLRALAREWNLPIATLAADVLTALRRMERHQTFDVVYADPPYGFTRYTDLVSAIDQLSLAGDVVVGIEHRSRSGAIAWPDLDQLVFQRTATYGMVAISIFDGEESTIR